MPSVLKTPCRFPTNDNRTQNILYFIVIKCCNMEKHQKQLFCLSNGSFTSLPASCNNRIFIASTKSLTFCLTAYMNNICLQNSLQLKIPKFPLLPCVKEAQLCPEQPILYLEAGSRHPAMGNLKFVSILKPKKLKLDHHVMNLCCTPCIPSIS